MPDCHWATALCFSAGRWGDQCPRGACVLKFCSRLHYMIKSCTHVGACACACACVCVCVRMQFELHPKYPCAALRKACEEAGEPVRTTD